MRVSSRTAKIVTLLAAVLAVLTGIGAAGVSAVTASSPWSQTDYNAAQSRANVFERTLTPATMGKVQYLRGVVTPLNPPGNPPRDYCTQNKAVAPVLTGGSMYAVMNGHVTKYNPATGKVIWQRVLDPSFENEFRALAVGGGLVVVGGWQCISSSNQDGRIQAFSASTGAPAWSARMNSEAALRQMVVSGGYVVALSAGGVASDEVRVLKLATGALAWSSTYGVPSSCSSMGDTVLVVARLVISGGCDENWAQILTARNIATGAVAWSRPGSWHVQRGDISGRHVYATDPNGAVVSLDPLTGQIQYTLEGATKVLAVDTARAYADCNPGGVCAYSTTTGALQWTASPGYTPGLAAEAGRVLYLDQGRVLNAATGQTIISQLWEGNVPWHAATASALVIGDGRIAVVIDQRVIDLFGLPGS